MNDSVASVTVIEVWDKRTGANVSRRIEYPSGKVEYLEPYPANFRPYYWIAYQERAATGKETP